jgi:hypothetical protein
VEAPWPAEGALENAVHKGTKRQRVQRIHPPAALHTAGFGGFTAGKGALAWLDGAARDNYLSHVLALKADLAVGPGAPVGRGLVNSLP